MTIKSTTIPRVQMTGPELVVDLVNALCQATSRTQGTQWQPQERQLAVQIQLPPNPVRPPAEQHKERTFFQVAPLEHLRRLQRLPTIKATTLASTFKYEGIRRSNQPRSAPC